MSLAAAVAAIILSSIAAVFICGALYLYLVSVAAAPALAALLVGLATMTAVGSIILALAIMSQRRAHDRRICAVPTPVGPADEVATNLGGWAGREFTLLAQAHPYYASVLALLGGLAIGRSSDLRNVLRKTLQS
jgi:hypothetical protein